MAELEKGEDGSRPENDMEAAKKKQFRKNIYLTRTAPSWKIPPLKISRETPYPVFLEIGQDENLSLLGGVIRCPVEEPLMFVKTRLVVMVFLLTVGLMMLPAAQAGISGFNNGVGWTTNTNGNGSITFGPNSLQILDNGGSEAHSAWYNTPQTIAGGFTASFLFNFGGNLAADGFTFTLQNSAAGTAALGSGGGLLGLTGISPAASVEFDIFDNPSGTVYATGGLTQQSGGPAYINTAPVNFKSGDTIAATINYDGVGTLTETLTDTVTSATFSQSYATGDISAVLGTATPLVGFTGGTGGGSTIANLLNFSFVNAGPAIPEPATLILGALGFAGLVGYRYRRQARAA